MLARVRNSKRTAFPLASRVLVGENLGFVRSRGELSGLPRGTDWVIVSVRSFAPCIECDGSSYITVIIRESRG